jgi:hypothetical protein
MLRKISWLIAGLISLKIVNEIGYILINVSGEGVVFWKTFLPALAGCLLLGFCLLKGDVFFEYSKKLGTKKLNQIYKILIASFGISIVFMVSYYFANSTAASPKIFGSTKSISYLSCDTYSDASSCSGSCKTTNQVEVDFKIDKTRNIVLKTVYKDNHILQQRALEKCTVVDESNWICGDTSVKDSYFSEVRESMNNGKYYYFSALAIEGGHKSFACTR